MVGEESTVLKSAMNPFKLVIRESGGRLRSLLLKTNNDLRRDQLILCCIRLMNSILLVCFPSSIPLQLHSLGLLPHTPYQLHSLCLLPQLMQVSSPSMPCQDAPFDMYTAPAVYMSCQYLPRAPAPVPSSTPPLCAVCMSCQRHPPCAPAPLPSSIPPASA